MAYELDLLGNRWARPLFHEHPAETRPSPVASVPSGADPDAGLDAVDLAQLIAARRSELAYHAQLHTAAFLKGLLTAFERTAGSRDIGNLGSRGFAESEPTRWEPQRAAPPMRDGSRLFRAIVGQESGGKNVVNPDSGALGIGQVMPANVKAWSKEVLGESISVATFKSRPDLQRKIVAGKLEQYYAEGLRKHGDEAGAVRYAAAKWYSGRGELMNSTKAQYSKGRRYPSIKDYTLKVLRRYERV